METVLIIIIAVTGIATYISWQKQELFNKYLFNPYMIVQRKQYYRMITHAFLHGSWIHLIVNMLVLYSFGRVVIYFFTNHPAFETLGIIHFLILYFGSIIFSGLYSLAKQKDNPHYNAVGASGAVSAVVFTSIFFLPWNMIYFFGIIPIPGILFGALYLAYSYYMGKKDQDNIGHDAHFWGAIFGFAYPMLVDAGMISEFIARLLSFNI